MSNGAGDASTGPGTSAEPLLRLRADDLAARAFDDETVVLDLRSSTYISTNAAGSVLWSALAQGATRSQLVAALLSEFEVDAERAGADVDAFVADCRRRRLIAE